MSPGDRRVRDSGRAHPLLVAAPGPVCGQAATLSDVTGVTHKPGGLWAVRVYASCMKHTTQPIGENDMTGQAPHRRPKEYVYRGMLFRVTIYPTGIYAFTPDNGWQAEWDQDDSHVDIWHAGVTLSPTLFEDSEITSKAPPLTRRLAIQLMCHSIWEEASA